MIYILLTVLVILLQAFFSGIETGLVSVMRPRIHKMVKQGVRGAKTIEFFLNRSELMLATTLLGTNICVVCASMLGKKSFEDFGFEGKSAMLSASLILTALLLAAEIIPKNYFRQAPAERCVKFAGLLRLSYYVLALPAHALSAFTSWTVRLFGTRKADSRTLLSEDFRLLLRESESAKIIDSQAAELLDRALDFYSLKIGELMVPAASVVTISKDQELAEALDICSKKGLSRLIVVDGDGNWRGVFSIYEAMFGAEKKTLEECIRQPASVNANAGPDEALTAARKAGCPMLFVQDKNRCTVGIITVEDIVRRIF